MWRFFIAIFTVIAILVMAKGARNMKIFAKYFDENGEVYMFRPNKIYDSATNTFKPTDEKTFTVAMKLLLWRWKNSRHWATVIFGNVRFMILMWPLMNIVHALIG